MLGGLALVSCGGGGSSGPSAGSASPAAPTPTPTSTPIPSPTPTPTLTSIPSPTPSPTFGSDAFAKGDCVGSDSLATASGGYREIPCDGPGAVAEVLLREEFDTVKADRCDTAAAEADLLIHLTREDPQNHGRLLYAEVCLRNLADPHPGAPGAGGGPNIVKGDCLLERKTLGSGSTLEKTVFETPCTDSGSTLQPRYKVIAVVPLSIAKSEKQKECPADTEYRFARKREFTGDLYCAVGV